MASPALVPDPVYLHLLSLEAKGQAIVMEVVGDTEQGLALGADVGERPRQHAVAGHAEDQPRCRRLRGERSRQDRESSQHGCLIYTQSTCRLG